MPRKKLKHNPKLGEKSGKSKKGSSQRDIDPYEEKRSYSQFYMALVFVGVVVVIIALVFVVFTQSGIRIQQYDSVRIHYEIYTLADYESHNPPSIKETNTWLNVCSRYDSDCEGGLIKGFYYNLLGKRDGDILNYQLLERCRDADGDGINDLDPPNEALSYGNTTDLLYDKDIVLWFKIHEINVSISTEAQAQISCEGKIVRSSDINNLVNYILVIKRDEREIFL
jgi:hypothetical protein